MHGARAASCTDPVDQVTLGMLEVRRDSVGICPCKRRQKERMLTLLFYLPAICPKDIVSIKDITESEKLNSGKKFSDQEYVNVLVICR